MLILLGADYFLDNIFLHFTDLFTRFFFYIVQLVCLVLIVNTGKKKKKKLQRLCSDFRGVVLIRTLPGALNRLILPMTLLF